MGSRIWATLTAAATNAVGAAANIFAMPSGNEAPNQHGVHQVVGAKEGPSVPDRPARSKRTRAAREGGKQEQPRKKKKQRKSSAAAAGQMGARTEAPLSDTEERVHLEPLVKVQAEEPPFAPQGEYMEMALDAPLEASLPPQGHSSAAVALWEQVAAAQMEASQAAFRAKHLRETAERAEREKADLQARVAALRSRMETAGPPTVDMVSTCGPIQTTTHAPSAQLNGGFTTEVTEQQSPEATQEAGPSMVAAPPVFQTSEPRGRPQRVACLGLEAPPNPLCPDPEADPEEDGLTSAHGGALGPSANVTTAPKQSGGRRQYGLRSRETDRKGKAKVPWDIPSSSENGTASESGPSAVPANTPGTTLEYDDVMSRVMPGHARFEHGPSRAVRVTKRRKPTFAYAAKVAQLSPETQADLARFHTWLTHPPPTWHAGHNCEESAKKIVDRVRGMLGWLSFIAERANVADVRLRDVVPSADKAGAALVHEHVNWLAVKRTAVAATLQCVYRSLLHLAMYLHHTESNLRPDSGQAPYNDVEVVAELRSYAGLLQRKAKKAPKVADLNAKLVAWPAFVGVVLKELRAECAGLYEKGSKREGIAIAKSVQKYLIMAILAFCGDRQRTIRELKVGETLVKESGRWVICLQPKHHKTGGSGAQRPKIPLPACVSADLDTYLDTWRKYLKPKHKFVFCSATGRQLDASGLCHSFRETVYRIMGLKMNPHLVRVAIVMHFRGQAATDRELEALALCMGHSVAVQRTIYDQRSVDDKAGPALAMVEVAFEKLRCIS